MCSPNISNRSRRKSPNPCVTSRCGPSKSLLAGIALTLAATLGGSGSALAQVERRQLPVLQGEAPPLAEEAPATPPAAPSPEWTPRPQTYAPALPQGSGAAQGKSALP